MCNGSTLSHFSTHWIFVANLINTFWLFQMVTWQVTAKIKGWGMLWHIPEFCLPHFQTTFFLCISLLLYCPCYCWPLANMTPLLPRFWEHWNTKKNGWIWRQIHPFLFPTIFNLSPLFSYVSPPFLHPFSPHQYYLVLILPAGFSCSPCKLMHHQ